MASSSAVRELVDFFAELENLVNKYKRRLAAHEQHLIVEGVPGTGDSLKHERKRKRQNRDPNAPKRPMSAYLCYSMDARKKIKNDHPEYKNTEIMSKIAEMWENVNEGEKKKYEDRAAQLKEKYLKELEDYNSRIASGEIPNSPHSQKLAAQYVTLGDEDDEDPHDEDEESEEESDSSGESDEDGKKNKEKKKKRHKKKKL